MSSIAAQAAEWVLRLSEENAALSQDERQSFEDWYASDERHRKALDAMQGLVGALHTMPTEAAHAALKAGQQQPQQNSWSALSKTLLVTIMLLMPISYMFGLQQQMQIWLADKRTEANEWRSWTLEDTSKLTLAGNSAVDIEFDAALRQFILLRGELLIDVARDLDRPLRIETQYGQFEALGTRFTVQLKEDHAILTVLESKVKATLNNKDVTVAAGQQLKVYSDHFANPKALDIKRFERNWKAGQFVANGVPLTKVLKELSHYHKGRLLFDEVALSSIPVMAVLPMQKPERALALLKESLPIEVQEYSPWIIHIASKEK